MLINLFNFIHKYFPLHLWNLTIVVYIKCRCRNSLVNHLLFLSQPSSPSSTSHLLMVSSSSESQKLVVSSSLLITVLELSYPARWRSSRLWPFIRGPGTPQKKKKKKKKEGRYSQWIFMFAQVNVYIQTFLASWHSLIISHIHCLDVGCVPHLEGIVKEHFSIGAVICCFSPCGSMPSLCRGRSLLKETTDSVSVWSSKVSTLPVALGL